jgi:hypothetical protein
MVDLTLRRPAIFALKNAKIKTENVIAEMSAML